LRVAAAVFVPQAIQHLERIITVKFDVFNKPSSTRRVPRGLTLQSVVLADVVEWLFERCGLPQTGTPRYLNYLKIPADASLSCQHRELHFFDDAHCNCDVCIYYERFR